MNDNTKPWARTEFILKGPLSELNEPLKHYCQVAVLDDDGYIMFMTKPEYAYMNDDNEKIIVMNDGWYSDAEYLASDCYYLQLVKKVRM